MYKIESKNYGYKLTFSEYIKADEMKNWVEESKEKLKNSSNSFGIFVDMRTLKPLAADAQAHMEEGQKHYKKEGMTRSVVILNSAIITMQFKRLAKKTGIYEWERYISAAENPNWEQTGIDWISNAKDPDIK